MMGAAGLRPHDARLGGRAGAARSTLAAQAVV